MSPRSQPQNHVGSGLIWVALAVLLQSSALAFAKRAGLESLGGGFLQLVWNPWYAAQILALGLQAGSWIMALRALPLSLAYPFMSLVLPLNLLIARLFFGEEVRALHAAGIALIAAGIWLVCRRTGKAAP